MKATKVCDLMIPAAEYPSVSHDATLKEALVILADSEKMFSSAKAWPRSVLALNQQGRVVGKITHWDVLRALEPKYRSMGNVKVLHQCGWSASFIKSMLQTYDLLNKPLPQAGASASGMRVRDIMTELCEKELLRHEHEIVDHDESLKEVIHLLLMGNLTALYVRKGKHIVGVVRLSDVFHEISRVIFNSG